MLQPPNEFLPVILPYANLFCKRVFSHVQLLLAVAILAPGKRTVSSVLRIVGLSQEKAFHKYHRVRYVKDRLTFGDALAAVRYYYLWHEINFCTSGSDVVQVKMSRQQYQLWQNALAWAA